MPSEDTAAGAQDDTTPLSKGIRQTYVGALRLAKSCHQEELLDGAEYSQAKQEANTRYNDAMKERQQMRFKDMADMAEKRKRPVSASCDDSSLLLQKGKFQRNAETRLSILWPGSSYRG